MGWFYYNQGRYHQAAEAFERAIELPRIPSSVTAISAGHYIAPGRYNDAIAALEHSISIRPSYVAYSNWACAYFGLRRYEDPAKTLNKP